MRRGKLVQLPDPTTFIVPFTLAVTLLRFPNDDLLLRWSETAVTVHIYHSTTPDQIDTFCKTVTAATETVVAGLDKTQRFYFKLQFVGGKWNGRTVVVAERVLPVGVVNFRDVGGYETEDGRFVRWGKLYRAGALLNLADADVVYLHGLGLTTVCDLRTAEESKKYPDHLPKDVTYQQFSVSNVARWTKWRGLFAVLFDRQKLHDFMLEGYTTVMVDQNPQIIAQIFKMVADVQNLPLLIHCTAGKDRTGLAIALLLHCLGVSQEQILADYTLSNHFYAEFKQVIAPDIAGLRYVGIEADDLHAVLIVRATLLQATFAHIEQQYGSVAAYLQDHVGIDDTMIIKIRENLLLSRRDFRILENAHLI